MNSRKKSTPLPPIRVSSRIQARAASAAADKAAGERRLSIEGLGAAKEARGFALLQEKQVHVTTKFEQATKTTTTTTTTTTLAVGSQTKGYSVAAFDRTMMAAADESRLSMEGLGAAKGASGYVLLQEEVQEVTTNFEQATTTTTTTTTITTLAVGSQAKGYSVAACDRTRTAASLMLISKACNYVCSVKRAIISIISAISSSFA
eukprot:CAMPEP_0168215564 /NCGR_PEP_ID=MMETSP0140_2-20121125/6049_1 /TAXON_ID=44445 /ORGANISM="Pseudo-nitzschia australis, Strain 10249 10 AB" /LENGTH=204 /DNA_ID=CAMNT_0008142797 /DNA_START=728 /DNA_END=1342 /DNA_ORIENTATION=+